MTFNKNSQLKVETPIHKHGIVFRKPYAARFIPCSSIRVKERLLQAYSWRLSYEEIQTLPYEA
jgi:hypothetical protein